MAVCWTGCAATGHQPSIRRATGKHRQRHLPRKLPPPLQHKAMNMLMTRGEAILRMIPRSPRPTARTLPLILTGRIMMWRWIQAMPDHPRLPRPIIRRQSQPNRGQPQPRHQVRRRARQLPYASAWEPAVRPNNRKIRVRSCGQAIRPRHILPAAGRGDISHRAWFQTAH